MDDLCKPTTGTSAEALEKQCADVMRAVIRHREQVTGVVDNNLWEVLQRQTDEDRRMYGRCKSALEAPVPMCVDKEMLSRVERALYAVEHSPKDFALLPPLRAMVLDLNRVIAEHIQFRREIQQLRHDKLLLISELIKLSFADPRRFPTFQMPISNFANRQPGINPQVTFSVGLS